MTFLSHSIIHMQNSSIFINRPSDLMYAFTEHKHNWEIDEFTCSHATG